VQLLIVPVTPFQQNCSILVDEGSARAVVVDPGGDLDRIDAALAGTGATLEKVLLTHGHSDHIAGNRVVKDRWPDAPIAIGRHDADKLVDPRKNLSAAFGLPIESPPADRMLQDGDAIDAAGFSLVVREIPGHSTGHVVFVSRHEPGLVVGGDVLFRGSIGRTDFPDGDHAALIGGIREKLYGLPDATIVLPGHGGPTTIGDERRHNPFT
jgi:glyoxylase-like metal-dependent hydrolase (beta-lactamase superfamily II)